MGDVALTREPRRHRSQQLAQHGNVSTLASSLQPVSTRNRNGREVQRRHTAARNGCLAAAVQRSARKGLMGIG
eukprot:4332445-Pleurochrysis_carterae.AAC.2